MYSWGKTHEVYFERKPIDLENGVNEIYKTKNGSMFCGDSSLLLESTQLKKYINDAQLIFTSPPFPLVKKKKYGNLQGEHYIEQFSDYAPKLKHLLKPDGSIVVEIGNVWEPGRPVMSTVVMLALLKFLEKGGLNLCQEFVWYNPARLPSPTQWVNVERIRVKDAFTKVWWMSPSDRPKADNRKILRKYSSSMEKLIKSGKYNAGTRPSQHVIGAKSFKKNNEGSISPNVINADKCQSIKQLLDGHSLVDQVGFDSLLKVTNTNSNEGYQDFCRTHGVNLHPARMPSDLVELFIRFLTDEKDLVLDPFAGSNTTGYVAETLNRRWMGLEKDWDYAASSIARFSPSSVKKTCKFIDIKQI